MGTRPPVFRAGALPLPSKVHRTPWLHRCKTYSMVFQTSGGVATLQRNEKRVCDEIWLRKSVAPRACCLRGVTLLRWTGSELDVNQRSEQRVAGRGLFGGRE